MPSRSKRIPIVFWIVLLWWTAFSLVYAIQIVRMGAPEDDPATWAKALQIAFGGWMTWVPLSLGLYWLVQRFPLERGRIVRSACVLTVAVLAVVWLRALYVYGTNSVFGWYRNEPLPGFGSVLATSMDNNFVLAWIVVGLVHAMVFHQRSQVRAQKVAELEASLISTQLDVLRARLNPHFLFNALNSVAEMVHRDADLAERMLVSLSSLLRDSLSPEQDRQRLLREEIARVQHYLMIEKIRLGERLQVEWQVDEACLDVPVPALILQPLVENAIVHGIARRRGAGTLRVSGRIDAETLLLDVENSVAAGCVAVPGTGIGLHSTRKRLDLLFGSRASLTGGPSESERYLVRLRMPVSPRQAQCPQHERAGA